MKRLDPAARRAAMAWLVLFVLLFLVATWFVRHEDLSDLDRGARTLVRQGRAVALERVMRALSVLALGYVLLPVTLVCSVVLWRRRHRAVAALLPLIGVTAVGVHKLARAVVYVAQPPSRAAAGPPRRTLMMSLRRLLIVSVVLSLVCAAGAAPPAHAETTLRVVMHSDLKIVDPIWTTAYI